MDETRRALLLRRRAANPNAPYVPPAGAPPPAPPPPVSDQYGAPLVWFDVGGVDEMGVPRKLDDDDPVCAVCERDEGAMTTIEAENGETLTVCTWCFYDETPPNEKE